MIETRAEVIAAAAAGRLRARVAEQIRRMIPDARVTIGADAVAIEGRGLAARRDADPGVRWIGGGLR